MDQFARLVVSLIPWPRNPLRGKHLFDGHSLKVMDAELHATDSSGLRPLPWFVRIGRGSLSLVTSFVFWVEWIGILGFTTFRAPGYMLYKVMLLIRTPGLNVTMYHLLRIARLTPSDQNSTPSEPESEKAFRARGSCNSENRWKYHLSTIPLNPTKMLNQGDKRRKWLKQNGLQQRLAPVG